MDNDVYVCYIIIVAIASYFFFQIKMSVDSMQKKYDMLDCVLEYVDKGTSEFQVMSKFLSYII